MSTPIGDPNASANRAVKPTTPATAPATGYVSNPEAQRQYTENPKKQQDANKQAELNRYKENTDNVTATPPNAPLTSEQFALLARNRKTIPPSYFDSTTGITQAISSETEDSLILLSSTTKRMAAQYLDSLLGASPPKTDYATILTEATTQLKTNVAAALTDLDSVVSTFESFKTNLQGNGSSLFQAGTTALMKTLSKGFGKVETQRDELKFLRTFYSFSERRHAATMTEETKKEWRSWKRVLVSYP